MSDVNDSPDALREVELEDEDLVVDDRPDLWQVETAAIEHLSEEESHDAHPFEEVRDDQLNFDS